MRVGFLCVCLVFLGLQVKHLHNNLALLLAATGRVRHAQSVAAAGRVVHPRDALLASTVEGLRSL